MLLQGRIKEHEESYGPKLLQRGPVPHRRNQSEFLVNTNMSPTTLSVYVKSYLEPLFIENRYKMVNRSKPTSLPFASLENTKAPLRKFGI